MELRLRPFISSLDGPILARWVFDPAYQNYFRNLVIPPTFDDCLNYPKWGGGLVLMLEKIGEEEPLGMVEAYGMDSRGSSIRTGVLIDKRFHNKKLGHNAQIMFADYLFKQLSVRKVIVEFVEEHLINAYEKVGFKLEGRFLKEKKIGHQYVDELRMGCLTDDWKGIIKEVGIWD